MEEPSEPQIRFSSDTGTLFANFVFWSVLGPVVCAYGIYRAARLADPCLGLWLIFWGILVTCATGRRFWCGVSRVELNTDGLYYCRLGRSAVHVLHLSDIVKIRELRRRRGGSYGFSIVCRDRAPLDIEYDSAGVAHSLECGLQSRLEAANRLPPNG